MATTAAQASPRLTAVALPGIPGSVPAARRHVRDALGLYGLGEYAADAATVTSELAGNAVRHACGNGAATIGVTLMCAGSPPAVTILVSDSCSQGPVRRETPADDEQGRRLQIVEALSIHWGWRCEDGGKTVFAVLAREA